MTKPILFALSIVITACSSPADADELAEKCIRNQVPEGAKVSAIRARQVVASCQSLLDTASKVAVGRIHKREFDRADPKMAELYAERRQAVEHWFLQQLSDEIQPRWVRL